MSENDNLNDRSLENIYVDFLMAKYDWRDLTAETFRSALLEAIEHGNATKWIKTSDRMPEEDELVLCVNMRSDEPEVVPNSWSSYCSLYEFNDKRFRKYVTHWMPLPSLPKVE